jgi:2-dehydro-3-deoxyphosphooctonate aldolase (KDO 8-P synthase)
LKRFWPRGASTDRGQTRIVGIMTAKSHDTARLLRLNDSIAFANDQPLVLIGGMNVIEGRDILLRVAEHFVRVTQDLGVPYVFKASFDKANRSSLSSFRGPGLEEGLRLLQEVRETFDVPVLTDVHEPHQAAAVAQVADILQVPAFLARQTDLVRAIAQTGAMVHVKKPQFIAPQEMRHIIAKCAEAGNDRVLLGERGSSFGYNNLIVDMLGMDLMKDMGPVVFDVTHALQHPGGRADSADGRGSQALVLARSGVAVGIAGLFLEAHPDPSQALCDGPCALPLADLEGFLRGVLAVDRAVKQPA